MKLTGDHVSFSDLPAALVAEVIRHTTIVGDTLLEAFENTREKRNSFRKSLEQSGLLIHESTLGYPPLPTTCGTDGSYAIDRLLTTDLVAAASVAVEGLTPPSEKRHWEEPRYIVFVKSEPHHPDTATVLRAVMLGGELQLATKAPHDLVMIDGTLTLPIIYFNQALNKAPETPELQCSQAFLNNICDYLQSYVTILKAQRSDKQYVSLPKYSTRREVGKALGWPTQYDDRGLLSLLLKGGEMTRPVPLEPPSQEWHLATRTLPKEVRSMAEQLTQEIINNIGQVNVFYYKPHDWIPAVRVEIAKSIATNQYRLATVVQGIKHQCATAAMLEPYPVYLADRTVKALAKSIPTFRHVTTQTVAERYRGDIAEVFFALHGYRSESGG